jgi:hypothetical protein
VCLLTALSTVNRVVGVFNHTKFPKGPHDHVTDFGNRPRQIQVSDLSLGQRYEPALKLAKLAALGQLEPVYIPCRQQREYRRLVKYRQVVLGRIIRVQNNIRAIFARRGMEMVRGQKAWALERLELIAQHRKPLTNSVRSLRDRTD